jgi:diacylglycerol kinase (ATP)
MRVLLLHNPSAGGGDTSGGSLLRAIREAGHHPIYRSTKDGPTEAALAEETYDLVAVAGGDGTVGSVACSMTGNSAPLAILPMGTANNISTALGLSGPLPELIRRWSEGRRAPLDLGRAKANGKQRRFIESAGIGVFSQVMAKAEEQGSATARDTAGGVDRKLQQDVALFRETLERMAPIECRLEIDGVDYSGRYLLVEALNTGLVGPNLGLAPHADPSDGALDLAMLGESRRAAFIEYLLAREAGGTEHEAPPLERRRGRRIIFHANSGGFHLDDSLWPNRSAGATEVPEVDVSIEPAAVTLLLP